MAHFRRKPTPVDALQLRWDTWSEMCELADVGKFADGHPEGCYVDAEGRVTDDSNARIGLRMPYGPVGHVAVEGDWIVRMPDGELVVLKPVAFEALFESHADYEVEYRPRWPRYPHLDVVQEADRELREELKKLLVDARADAVQYVLDVRAEELLRARADERGADQEGSGLRRPVRRGCGRVGPRADRRAAPPRAPQRRVPPRLRRLRRDVLHRRRNA